MRQKQALTQAIKNRYCRMDKKAKGRILDELVATTGYNRSYARRLLNSRVKVSHPRQSPRTRTKVYDLLVHQALKTIWLAADNICSKRLKPFLPEFLGILERHQEITVDPDTRNKLLSISCATIDRLLLPDRRRYQLKGRSTTKPGSLLKAAIAIRTFTDWDDQRPGFTEADLVALCGDNVYGGFVNILDVTDVSIGWISLEAMMGKGQTGIHGDIKAISKRLPFSLLGLDSDNGTEFINQLLLQYCETHKITFTRIRPNHKNDNCFVEQKNYSVVRRFLGYARRDTEAELAVIKKMLPLIETYVNFFQPSFKLLKKIRQDNQVRKTYDTAQTPFQRLAKSAILSKDTERRLHRLYQSLNPMQLRRQISRLNQKLDQLYRYKLVESTTT